MCTAVHVLENYFGRNLDLEGSYGEKVCFLPRNAPVSFRRVKKMERHYAIMGMAVVIEGEPLFYDGVNEAGVCMAGLNFVGNACYHPETEGKDNVTPYEIIPWILGQCATAEEAGEKLEGMNLVNIPFSEQIPLATLHWMISDREKTLVVESMADGLHVYENPAKVMTNNPPFPYQLFNLNNYRALSEATPENHFSQVLDLDVYSRGLGGLGLPGDLSSMSRFVRAAFHCQKAVCEEEESSAVSQVFHILGTVEMPRGSCLTEKGQRELTVYSCCMAADTGRYYYTTYDNRRITCVDMNREDLNGDTLSVFELKKEQSICWQN